MSTISGIATSALGAFGFKQAVTANNIANINTPDFKRSDTILKENKGGGVTAEARQGNDRVEISREAIDMMVTSSNYGANLKSIQATDKMAKEALDLLK